MIRLDGEVAPAGSAPQLAAFAFLLAVSLQPVASSPLLLQQPSCAPQRFCGRAFCLQTRLARPQNYSSSAPASVSLHLATASGNHRPNRVRLREYIGQAAQKARALS